MEIDKETSKKRVSKMPIIRQIASLIIVKLKSFTLQYTNIYKTRLACTKA